MNWSAIAKLILLKLPVAVSVAEELGKPGADKKKVVLDQLHKELHEAEPALANHPKVLEAISKANDAVVEVANTISHVKGELESQSK